MVLFLSKTIQNFNFKWLTLSIREKNAECLDFWEWTKSHPKKSWLPNSNAEETLRTRGWTDFVDDLGRLIKNKYKNWLPIIVINWSFRKEISKEYLENLFFLDNASYFAFLLFLNGSTLSIIFILPLLLGKRKMPSSKNKTMFIQTLKTGTQCGTRRWTKSYFIYIYHIANK